MSRNFDGTDDRATMGSDASIDGFATRTIAMWVVRDTTVAACLLAKERAVAQWQMILRAAPNNQILIDYDFDGATNGQWFGSTAFTTGVRRHVVVTYDNGATTNDPAMYVNGVAETVTENSAPAGAAVSDAASSLLAGENAGGTNDLDGQIGWLCYDDAIWSAEEINRAMWWGRPFGGVQVYHPWVTEKVTNEGAATADAVMTGTSVASLVAPVQRPCSAMMGLGVGW